MDADDEVGRRCLRAMRLLRTMLMMRSVFDHHDEDDAAMRNTNPIRKYFLGVLQTVP